MKLIGLARHAYLSEWGLRRAGVGIGGEECL